MKIAYLFHLNELNEGVYKKIVAQIDAWKSYGHDVAAFQVTRMTPSLTSKKQWHIFNYKQSYKEFMSRLKSWDNAVNDIIKWKPDVVYYRYDIYYPALQRLMINIPFFVEVNTDDLKEYNLNSKMRGLYNLLTRGHIFNKVTGLVFVTNELASLPNFEKYNKRFTVIGNGIDLKNYEILSATNNKYPRLIFIGSPGQPWHGADKIISLARRRPSWFFDLVGVTKEDVKVDIPQNVICHGYMNRTGYKMIMEKADVAIGTLALHRINLKEAAPLKTREYLAYGLPVITGYKDTDFSDKSPFILQLPNQEDNVDTNIELIENFVKLWMGKRVERNEVQHLDIRVKERKRLEFIQEVIKNV